MMGPLYGCLPDQPDERDVRAPAPGAVMSAALARALPEEVDLRTSSDMPPVWHQGSIGSCTGHGTSAAFQYERRRQGLHPDYQPSRLFAYWNARALDGTTFKDGGATIRSAIKGLAKFGAPPEQVWPYEPLNVLTAPPKLAFSIGEAHQVVKYTRLDRDEIALRRALADGLPVVFGFEVPEAFLRIGSSGVMQMPKGSERRYGGHCALLVGYRMGQRKARGGAFGPLLTKLFGAKRNGAQFLVRNSWGSGWGELGYCWMPMDFVLSDQAFDFWTIEVVEA